MSRIRCLIVSDSHGDVAGFREALLRCGSVDAVFFLGDGLSDAEQLADSSLGEGKAWFVVRGNCDHSRPFCGRAVDKLGSVTLGGKRIVFTHGDLYGVKYHSLGLRGLASQTNADVVLFGHTHARHESYEDGLYLFNPGPLGGFRGSAGIMTLENDGILFSYMDI